MEYTSLKELYLNLLPVFNVKQRLISFSKYTGILNKDIWEYLTINKWKKSVGLTISDMINDIIIVDEDDIYKFKEVENEKN